MTTALINPSSLKVRRVVELRNEGLSHSEIAEKLGITILTSRTYARIGQPKVRAASFTPFIRGNRKVAFLTENGHVTRTWATVEERSAVMVEMMKAGYTTKMAARIMDVSPRMVQLSVQSLGHRCLDLRPHVRMVDLYVQADVRDQVQQYALRNSMAVGAAAQAIITAGIRALSEKETDNG